MDSNNYLNKKEIVKDNQKGHKIAAALYLVTQHLSDNDPLKIAIRNNAVSLITLSHEGRQGSIHSITALLETATLAQLISEKNTSVLNLELRHYLITLEEDAHTVAGLFTPVFENTLSHVSFTSRSITPSQSRTGILNVKSPILNQNKSKRQDMILSFINERKSAGIKDIAALFSDTSEKTIQRELGALVNAGKITKRGEKRWSIYLAV